MEEPDTTNIHSLDGKIDDVRVWNDIRTPTEIVAHKDTELTGTEANLVGYWQLDNALLDENANNNHLANHNAAIFVENVPFVGGGNQPPIAKAGDDQTVFDADDSGSEDVVLDGSGSVDGITLQSLTICLPAMPPSLSTGPRSEITALRV